MRVWVVQTGERLPLVAGTRMMRTGLLAQELASRGHEVTWWASAFDHYARTWADEAGDEREIVPNLKIRLLRGLGYSQNVSIRRFVDHALVARRFAAVAKGEPKPDVIVSALPDYRIAYSAFCYARRENIPFILDLRDRWPWDFFELIPKVAQPVARVLLARDFFMAKTLIKHADVLVTMMYSWQEWIASIGRVLPQPLDRVLYLGAEAPKQDEKRVGAKTRDAILASKDRWTILFVGAFTNRSWPKIAVELAGLFAERGESEADRPLFILAGDGDFMPELQRLSAGNPDIVLPGYVNDAEIAALLGCAKVGLVTGNADFEAVPNKVFTYLSGGVPIFSSLSGELKELLKREQVGLTFEDAAQMSTVIDELRQDEKRRAEMADRARVLFLDRYEASRLYGHYAQLVEQVGQGEPLKEEAR